MRHFKHWIQAYQDYAAFSESPPHMHYWAALGTIAGALRRRVWLDQIYFKWYCNCFIIFVARPGIVSKTTTIGIGMDMLKEVEGINFGPDSVTWQKLAEILQDCKEEFVVPATGDFIPMSAVTFESGEFGTLIKTQDKEMIDVMVNLWDGKKFDKATKGSGTQTIVNPWVNLLGCTTPSWIADNFPEYMIGGGFTSRCIFVYAEEKEKYIAYPRDVIPSDSRHIRQKLVEDLRLIANNIVGEYHLSAQAKMWGKTWYEEHYSKIGSLEDTRFHGYFARKQTHLHKIAMIIAAAKRDEMIIEREDMIEAKEALDEIEGLMPAVFSLIGRTELSLQVDQILAFIHAQKEIDYQTIYRRFHRFFPDEKEFNSAMNGIVQAGYAIITGVGPGAIVKPGRHKPGVKKTGIFTKEIE